ncbi:MAG: hypothetical protein ABSG43_12405 [Solirubrobacteraceae bacterium]
MATKSACESSPEHGESRPRNSRSPGSWLRTRTSSRFPEPRTRSASRKTRPRPR